MGASTLILVVGTIVVLVGAAIVLFLRGRSDPPVAVSGVFDRKERK